MYIQIKTIHARFWQAQQHCPAWVVKARNNKPAVIVTIDNLVNIQGKVKSGEGRTNDYSAHNLLALLRSYRHRGESLRANLARLALDPGTIIQPKRRAAFAKKWLNRIG